MRSINDFFDFIQDYSDSYAFAMEAEDITGGVTQQVSDIAKGSSPDNSNKISTDVDDLFGTKNPENDHTNDIPKGAENDLGSENTDDSSQENDEEADPDSSLSEDNMSDNPGEGMSEEETKSKEFEDQAKFKVWKEMRASYDSLETAIDLVTKFMPDLSDMATIKSIGTIKENLTEAKNLAYRTLTAEYKIMSYPEMQKRQIGISNIYDLGKQELATYFDKYHKTQ